MTENERVNKVRNDLGLTLEEFGKRLGVTRSAVSNIVNGSRGVTDQMRTSICREYGVSAEWLRTGSGDEFTVSSPEREIQELADEVMKDSPDSFRRKFVTALARLTPDQWRELSDIADTLLEVQRSEADPMADIDRETEEYRRQLIEQKRAAGELPASDTGSAASGGSENVGA